MTDNRILQGLTPSDFDRLRSRFTPVQLTQHAELYPINGTIEYVYFVEAGLVSLLNVSENGDMIEAGVIGAEGVVGGVAVIDAVQSSTQATVQISGNALRMTVGDFRAACASLPHLKRLVHQHIQILLFQAQQNATCHALHSVECRLCRWMLQAQDVTQSNILDLTQEFISHMLGVQRTSVSMIAQTLQQAGFIKYSRGRIEILDKLALHEAACECYNLIKHQIDARIPARAPVPVPA